MIQHGVEEGLCLARTCARNHQRGIRSAFPVLVAAAQPAERLRLVVVRRKPRRQPVQDPVPPGRTRVGEPRPHVRPVEHAPFCVLQKRFQRVGCLRVLQRERGGQILGNSAEDVLGCVDGDGGGHEGEFNQPRPSFGLDRENFASQPKWRVSQITEHPLDG